MIIQLHAGLGDTVALTAGVRERKRRYPDDDILLDVSYPEVFIGNPFAKVLAEKSSDKTAVIANRGWGGQERFGDTAFNLARRLGIDRLADTTPEVFLSREERLYGKEKVWKAKKERHVPAVAFDPWTTWPSRRWRGWHELTMMLANAGVRRIRLGADIQDIDGESPNPDEGVYSLNLYGRTTVREAAAVLAAADLYIGNDSGLFHLAAAVGTPQVIVFANRNWYTRGYWNTTSLFHHQECDSRCGRRCFRPFGKECLSQLPAQYVFECVKIVLKRMGRGYAV